MTTAGHPAGRDWPQPGAGLERVDPIPGVLSLIHASSLPMFLVWGPGQDWYCNTACHQHLDASGPNRPGPDRWDSQWEALLPLLRQVRETGQPVLTETTLGDGLAPPSTRNRFLLSLSPVHEHAGHSGILGILVDRGLMAGQPWTGAGGPDRSIEQRYEAIRKATNDVIWDWDLDTDQVSWSDAALSQFGFTADELGSTRRQWVALIHADDRARILHSILEARDRGRETWSAEYRFRRKDGSYGTFLDRAIILRDRESRPVRMIGSMLNVTHRRALEEEVRHAQKMQAVGKLAGGMAHEVNNMMTAVLGFGDLILKELPPDHPQRADVEEMVKAGERAARVTQQLLAFTRQQSPQWQVLDLNRLVQDLARMLERLLGADTPLTVALSPGIGKVRADQSQLEQLLINLVHNARDAMPTGGAVTIRTRNVELGPPDQERHPGVPLRFGPYVELTVTDTGTGMDEATVRRAFEPFFTTKPVGKGTGLGLSTVYGTVKQHDGYVWIATEPDRGTTITIHLPLVAGDEGRGQDPAARQLGGAETVLIVEDEPMVLTMARRALETEGYLVLEARDGVEALEVLRAFGDQVRLVITDLIMPRLGGRELGDQLKLTAPGVPVLFMSAYAGDEVIQRGQLDRNAPFLQKPFTPFVLLRKIRELLDQAPVTRFDSLG